MVVLYVLILNGWDINLYIVENQLTSLFSLFLFSCVGKIASISVAQQHTKSGFFLTTLLTIFCISRVIFALENLPTFYLLHVYHLLEYVFSHREQSCSSWFTQEFVDQRTVMCLSTMFFWFNLIQRSLFFLFTPPSPPSSFPPTKQRICMLSYFSLHDSNHDLCRVCH